MEKGGIVEGNNVFLFFDIGLILIFRWEGEGNRKFGWDKKRKKKEKKIK